jgi:hypothetical protein
MDTDGFIKINLAKMPRAQGSHGIQLKLPDYPILHRWEPRPNQ